MFEIWRKRENSIAILGNNKKQTYFHISRSPHYTVCCFQFYIF